MIVEKKSVASLKRSKTVLDRMIQEIIERDNEAEIQIKAKNIKNYILNNQDL